MAPRQIHDVRKRRPLSPEGRQRVDDIKRANAARDRARRTPRDAWVTQASVAEEPSTSRPNVGRIEKELDNEDVKLTA
jgi:hypothetical protein